MKLNVIKTKYNFFNKQNKNTKSSHLNINDKVIEHAQHFSFFRQEYMLKKYVRIYFAKESCYRVISCAGIRLHTSTILC